MGLRKRIGVVAAVLVVVLLIAYTTRVAQQRREWAATKQGMEQAKAKADAAQTKADAATDLFLANMNNHDPAALIPAAEKREEAARDFEACRGALASPAWGLSLAPPGCCGRSGSQA